MATLPRSDNSLLVRTDFTDEEAWQRTRDAALAENEEGFRAYVQVVDDPGFADATWEELAAEVMAADSNASVLFVADGPALVGDHPILVADLFDEGRSPFRCVAAWLWSVDNNLNLANMDWEEFADALAADGVYRGFESAHRR